MSELLVYIEVNENGITDLSLQCLAKGAELAKKNGWKVGGLVLGAGVKDCAKEVIAYGADTVYLADDARLKSFVPSAYQRVLTGFLKQKNPGMVIFPATTRGNDLAPLIASELDLACALDCQNTDWESGKFFSRRSEFDGKVATKYSASGSRGLVTSLKDGVADSGTADAARTGQTVPVEVVLNENDLATKVLKREVVKSTVNLKAAKIIVTAGAGIGTKENFALVENLARAFGGEVGATRPVVDAGWTTADRQIGQTGVTVKPDLYIACGVSGAVQHRVGMMMAKKIVAINTDAAAPIFKFAHYRIVGDLVDVIPKLLKLVK
ncbi:MAG TPA: electron transfer flavoprotein subunit alpha/FixB family protein [Candidatus Omnitrophota bacterium]|nr:electron transfer flavoprotein subunit alpha/FixB family protein [Candidatus Omnitrophota bacterium]